MRRCPLDVGWLPKAPRIRRRGLASPKSATSIVPIGPSLPSGPVGQNHGGWRHARCHIPVQGLAREAAYLLPGGIAATGPASGFTSAMTPAAAAALMAPADHPTIQASYDPSVSMTIVSGVTAVGAGWHCPLRLWPLDHGQ